MRRAVFHRSLKIRMEDYAHGIPNNISCQYCHTQ
ncbi:hypothetical protein AFE_1528 [Acidithiobacillus ferrooxidans ATCC 23270]|uniref:Uncharacterized protein n=1 Tax=Acidithiobacillus ferrooxidans (strain ATCC 23270 / DSM 14882 / CIP 104768 / NCIMB 8455) TaxID=243159 RepID=B7JAA5_ACIF2|nr:hypothetical protein AFE_1528 [Acidithiobacillus ferrooxidans ATCC 23270]